MYQRILVPVDGSDTSTRGLQEAIALASELGSVLCLLHVVDLQMIYMNMAAMGLVTDCIGKLQESGAEVIQNARQIVEAAGVKVETRIVESSYPSVADMIVAEVEHSGAELVIMGTHGRRGVRHMVMGSDAEGVVRRSGVPVLLIRLD